MSERSSHINIALRVEVGSQGAWQNLAALDGYDWVESARWREDIDLALASGSVTLKREIDGRSVRRVLDGTVFPGGQIRIATATVEPGQRRGTFRRVFQGRIDAVEWASNDGTARIRMRDQGAALMDTMIWEEVRLGSPTGRRVDLVIRDILERWMGVGAVPLHVATPTDFRVFTYTQERMSVFEACRSLALQAGLDLRYRRQPTGSSWLTLCDPAELEIDAGTYDHDHWIAIEHLSSTDLDVVNLVEVRWRDLDDQVRSTTAQDVASVARYGTRYLLLDGEATAHIRESEDARHLANTVLADLAHPESLQSVRVLYNADIQLGAKLRFTPDGIHHEAPFDGSVTAFEHELSGGAGYTTITTQGRPAVARIEWIRRATY